MNITKGYNNFQNEFLLEISQNNELISLIE